MASIKEKVYNIIRDDENGGNLLSIIVDSIILFFIIINVVIIILDTFDSIRLVIESFYPYIEKASLVVFTVEYLLRFWTSDLIYMELPPLKARIKYFFTIKSLIDLLSLLPFYLLFFKINIRLLRMIRLVRILGILKVNRYSKAISTVGQVIKSKAAQLLSSFFVVFLLIVFSSVLMYYIEHDAQPGVFDNAFSGLWWAIATLTTVGYGDIYPITVFGKILGTFIALLGIGFVAVPTGIISAGFIEQMSAKNKPENNNYCPHCGKRHPKKRLRYTRISKTR